MVLVMTVTDLDAALARVSLLHVSLGLRRRSDRSHRRLAVSRLAGVSRERRRGKYGSGKQCSGNRLEHGPVLIKGDLEVAGRLAGLFDHGHDF